MSSAITYEGIPRKVKDRPLLLATRFNYSEDLFDKSAAQIGLGAMRKATPEVILC